jgi:hypothetical protein
VTRASRCARASATRGGRTTRLGTGVTPAKANSSCSGPDSIALAFMASTSARPTTLTTISPVVRALTSVSFSRPPRRPTDTTTVGGADETSAKKE